MIAAAPPIGHPRERGDGGGYVAVRLDAEAADADAWCDALLDAGAQSVDVADPRAGGPGETAVFGEPGSDSPAWWPVSRLTALCARGADAAAIVAAAARSLARPVPP